MQPLDSKPADIQFWYFTSDQISQDFGRAATQGPATRSMSQVQPEPGVAAGANDRRTVGHHGAGALPFLDATCQTGRTRKPVVQYLVQGLQGTGALLIGRAANLGTA